MPFVTPRGRSQILELVSDGSMPPGNKPGPTDNEVATLEKWVQAGAPAFPPAFDEPFTLGAIADDLERGNDAKVTRYVSFAHLVHDGKPSELATAERQLNDALSAVAGSPVKLEAVDPTATLYRIKLANLGWHTRELFEKVNRLKPDGPHSLRPFDLVLLEYPFATRVNSPRLEKFLAASNQIRPVPYVRGDWLTAALVRDGQPTPLAEDLKSLVLLERTRASGAKDPDGPATPRRFGSYPLTPEKPVVGRESIPPLSGWYVADVPSGSGPFGLTAELVSDGQKVATLKEDQRFYLRVRSDKRVNLTLLLIRSEGDIRVDKLAGGSVLQAEVSRDVAFAPEGFLPPGNLAGPDGVVGYLVLFATLEEELPRPLVVRSQHNERPVWRFLLEQSELFDPNMLVRKVLPIRVSKK